MATILPYALTTLANVKDLLDITDASQDDVLINYINAATEVIERYTGRRFLETTYTNEVYDGLGSRFIVLKNSPVTALTSKQKLVSDYQSDNWDDLEESVFDFSPDGRVYYSWFSEGFRNYRFSYTAGYATIPDDIRDAAEKLVQGAYQSKTSVSSGTTGAKKSESLGEYSVSYADAGTTSSTMTSMIKTFDIQQVLDLYRTPTV